MKALANICISWHAVSDKEKLDDMGSCEWTELNSMQLWRELELPSNEGNGLQIACFIKASFLLTVQVSLKQIVGDFSDELSVTNEMASDFYGENCNMLSKNRFY
jgi:hypothetical protein